MLVFQSLQTEMDALEWGYLSEVSPSASMMAVASRNQYILQSISCIKQVESGCTDTWVSWRSFFSLDIKQWPFLLEHYTLSCVLATSKQMTYNSSEGLENNYEPIIVQNNKPLPFYCFHTSLYSGVWEKLCACPYLRWIAKSYEA